jgi:hypothetical protein
MAVAETRAAQFALELTAEERDELLLFLEQAIREKRVEVHRTEAFAARELVGRQLTVLEGLLDKLRRR